MMTTDLITFFHPRGSTGKDWTFSPQYGDTTAAEIWVFDRSGKADFSRFASMKVSSKEEFQSMIDEVHALIQQSGGIYFYAYDHNGVICSKMVRVESSGYAPPKRMLRLSPADGTRFEDITGKADFAPGDHLVVPVSATAEQRLQAFYNDLDGFPADLQSLILNVIRRPSLEWRIHRLERTISGLPAASQALQQQEQMRRGSWLDKLYGVIMRPLPIGPTVAALLLLTAGTLFAFDKLFSSGKPADENRSGTVQASTTQSTDPPAEPSPAPQTANSEDVNDALEDLYDALNESEDEALRKLYDSHFKDHEEFSKTSPAVWGIAKLEALKSNLAKGNEDFWEKPDRQAAVKSIYTEPLKKGELGQESLTLLAWSCCRSFEEPKMPETRSEPKASLSFEAAGQCNAWDDKAVARSIESLTTWVKDRS